MQEIINSPRSGCGLHGAVQTVSAIKGAVPIVHSNSGCAVSNYLANKASGTAAGYVSGYSVPGTDSLERHIIFGGASRLREQIKNTLKVVNGDLYIVLNSCEAAMVGDDIDAMTREVQEQGEPVIDSLTAGFHGDTYYGYENVVADILKKLPDVRKIEKNTNPELVNLFGILPGHDIYYRGVLEELSRLLQGLGLKTNLFFGQENGVEEFADAQNAGLSIVFSKWGLKAAEHLKAAYEIPILPFLTIPVGPEQTENLLREVGRALDIQEDKVEACIGKERKYFRYYFKDLLDDVYEQHAGKNIALVGDAAAVLSLAEFLGGYFGAAVKGVVITDLNEKEFGEAYNKDSLKQLSEAIYFSKDNTEIRSELKTLDVEFILGSSLEETTADEKNIPILPVSYPAYHQSIADKSYAGIKGALRLAEDFLTKIKQERVRRTNAAIAGALGNGRQ
ncbi:MAG: nitrogenase component 1 [Ruminiclostridium sp.]